MASQKKLLDFDSDEVDSIPVVELKLDDLQLKKKSSKRSKKKPVVVPVYAEEEMPENAAFSDTEEVSKKKKKNGTVYTKKSTRDIFESLEEESGLNSVDLNTPLGADEKFEQPKTYLSPEEVRIKEEARYRAERKELRALQVYVFIEIVQRAVSKKKRKKKTLIEKEQGPLSGSILFQGEEKIKQGRKYS